MLIVIYIYVSHACKNIYEIELRKNIVMLLATYSFNHITGL